MLHEARGRLAGSQHNLLGISTLLRKLYRREDVTADWNALVERYKADALDTAALLDISLLLHTTGQMDKGLGAQRVAVEFRRVYRRVHGSGTGPQVICFVIEGDMTANTPVDFLLEGSDAILHLVFIREGDSELPTLPDADIAIMAIGESPKAQPVLATLNRLLSRWAGPPIINGDTDLVASLTRDRVHELLSAEPAIVSPRLVRLSRAEMERVASSALAIESMFTGAGLPLLARPVGTHAAEGLEKLDERQALSGFLAQAPGNEFYCSRFLDYRSPDGLWRKYRVIFIEGRPFPAHLAISNHWMVHYLTANMGEHADRRAEEAAWMAEFETGFARRHERAFSALSRIIPLDYFGIDCSETQDGRLIVFELDNIMIVHDMDPPDLYPYKQPAMRRLFTAFQDMLSRRAFNRSPSASAEAPSTNRCPA